MSALNVILRAFAGPVAIDQYLLQTLALSSKPTGRRCCCRSMGQLDRIRPFHKPCSIYGAGSIRYHTMQAGRPVLPDPEHTARGDTWPDLRCFDLKKVMSEQSARTSLQHPRRECNKVFHISEC